MACVGLDRQTDRDMREMAGEGFDSDSCWLDKQTDKLDYRPEQRTDSPRAKNCS